MKSYKNILALIILIIFFLSHSNKASAQQVASDNFNTGISSTWTNVNNSAHFETFICGQACNSVKMACTLAEKDQPGTGCTTVGNGRLIGSFSVTKGATYQVSIAAGVFIDGANPDGRVTLTVTDGTNSQSASCTNQTCTASGNKIGGSLSVTITPQTSTLTIYLNGTQGECSDTGCHDPYLDDFVITQTAAAPPSLNDAATCASLTFNSANIIAGQNYTATVSMRNDGGTTWTSAADYKLGAQDPQDDPNWGTSTGADSGKGTRPTRVVLPSSTSPSSTATFSFGVTAPNAAGDYRFAWQMLREGVAWFGGKCGPNITVQAQPPTLAVTCSVSPTTATTGQNVTWTAAVSGGTLPYTYSWSGSDSLQGKTGNPVTVSYTTAGSKSGFVKVTDSAGAISPLTNCTNSVTITAPAPTVSLTANPISIANNTSSTLSWTTTSCTTTNSCSCSASGSWSGSKSISGGSQSTGNLTGPANYTYTLTCTNSNGTSLPSTANVSVDGASGAICTAETDAAFCSRLGKNCGSVTASDNCGTIKTVSCGTTCPSGQTCGGGGTPNVCGGSSSSSGTSPWIQTTGGDVHSNTNINTPGGP